MRGDGLREVDDALDGSAEDYELAARAGILDAFGSLVAPVGLGELLARFGASSPDADTFGESTIVGCHADGGS